MEVEHELDHDPEIVGSFTPHFEPLVHLTPVVAETGEENETEIAKLWASLYKFDKDTNEWKQRGRGDVKFLHNNGRVRLVLREDKTLKLRLNCVVTGSESLQANESSDRAWSWTTKDFSDGIDNPLLGLFAIKFKSAEGASEFASLFKRAQKGGLTAWISSTAKEKVSTAEEKLSTTEEKKVESLSKADRAAIIDECGKDIESYWELVDECNKFYKAKYPFQLRVWEHAANEKGKPIPADLQIGLKEAMDKYNNFATQRDAVEKKLNARWGSNVWKQ